MMRLVFLILSLTLVFPSLSFCQENSIALKTNFEGTIETGSIDDLITAIQQGKAIRVGWQLDFDKDGKAIWSIG